MSNFIKQPVPLYDEPAKYSKFDGGINNDPANENIRSNELRDAINADYRLDGNIQRRLGASKFKNLIFNDTNINDHRNIIQGAFNFVGEYNVYFVVVRDGYLYYSTLGESETYNLIEIPIDVDIEKKLYDPTNVIVGLDLYDPNGDLTDTDNPWYGKKIDTPEALPSNLSNHEGYILISEYNEGEDENRDFEGFNWASGIYRGPQPKLILQNYRPVQGAVFNDQLYIATGTRFIYIKEEVQDDEIVLVANIIEPYQPNGFDVQNIGYNYLSPFPSVYIADTYELATSRINGVLSEKHTFFSPFTHIDAYDNINDLQTNDPQDPTALYYLVEPNIYVHWDGVDYVTPHIKQTFRAVIDYKEGTAPGDYWFKWEYRVNDGPWIIKKKYVYGQGANEYEFDIGTLLQGQTVEVRCSYTNKFKTESVGQDTPLLKDGTQIKTTVGTDPTDGSVYLEVYQDGADYYLYKEVLTYSGTPRIFGGIALTEGAIVTALVTGSLTDKMTVEYEEVYIMENNDRVVDTTFAEFGQASTTVTVESGTIDTYEPTIEDAFDQIHKCNRLFTDGKMIILYGSTHRKGDWFKTIVNNFKYITAKNSLNFQTNKNERIVACLPLEGNIIVFADNPHLGGSIHKVYGNGDDYDAGDGYFSPYKKQIVNTSVSCDHPNSVQFVKNFIMFKYRTHVYIIDSRELNADRLNVTKVTRQISHDNPDVKMPVVPYSENYEYELFSEITDDFYSIIFPKEGVRWKMYYNMARQYEDQPGIYFPWLRDQGEIFNIDYVLTINNISTHVLDDKLIQYTDTNYKDLDVHFKTKFLLKAFDMFSPTLVKFVSSIIMYYYRGATDNLSLNVRVYNEAHYLLIGEESISFYDEATNSIIYDDPNTYYVENIDPLDRQALVLDVTTLEGSILGRDLLTSKTFRPDLKFPCLNAYVEIEIDSAEAFALSSITFDYATTDLPAKSLPNIYNEIIRKE